jgi:hypothetical protein
LLIDLKRRTRPTSFGNDQRHTCADCDADGHISIDLVEAGETRGQTGKHDWRVDAANRHLHLIDGLREWREFRLLARDLARVNVAESGQ